MGLNLDVEMLEKSKNVMMERGFYTANGYKFKISTVTLGEEFAFLTDFNLSMIPNVKNGEDVTDDDKAQLMIELFNKKPTSKSRLGEQFNKAKKKSLWQSIKTLFSKEKQDYSCEYYKDCIAYGIVKWIEKKVTLNDKPIRFYDLERKYELSKLEVYELLLTFMQLSNFPQHLLKK